MERPINHITPEERIRLGDSVQIYDAGSRLQYKTGRVVGISPNSGGYYVAVRGVFGLAFVYTGRLRRPRPVRRPRPGTYSTRT